VSGKKKGSEGLTKLQWTTIFDVGLCVGEKDRVGSLSEATVDRNLK
jgi:hypothetical protein